MGCAPQVQLCNLALIKNLISLPGNLHPFSHSSDSWFPAFWDLGRAWWNSFHIAYLTCKFEETVLRQVSAVGPSPSSGAWASPFPSLSLSIRICRWAGKTLQQGDSTVFNGMVLDCGKPLVNKWLFHSLTHGSKAVLHRAWRQRSHSQLHTLGFPPGAAEPECSELFRGPKAMVSMTAQANQGPYSPLKNLLLLLLWEKKTESGLAPETQQAVKIWIDSTGVEGSVETETLR